jgi:hypothetical protein
LGRNSRGKLAVLTALKQDRHYDFRITPRSHPHEPGIIFVFRFAIRSLDLERFSDCLRPALIVY